MQQEDTIKVLIVDDSMVLRTLYRRILSQDTQFEVVASIANGKLAVEQVADLNPHVIILDIEMPVMDGMTALPKLLEKVPNAKVIMSSTLTSKNAAISLEAMEKGAAEYIEKPEDEAAVVAFERDLKEKVVVLGREAKAAAEQAGAGAPPSLAGILSEIASLEKQAVPSQNDVVPASAPVHTARQYQQPKVLVIGSSTGGPQALMHIFEKLDGKLRHMPIFITQHMPPKFTTFLAEHLHKASGMSCVEPKDGEKVESGKVYIAPGDYHMLVTEGVNGKTIRLTQDEPENFCRPAVDPMLRSIANVYGGEVLVVILTGMGQDGREGVRPLYEKQARILVQDKESSVVWGMPGAVAQANLADEILPLDKIAERILEICNQGGGNHA